MTSRSPSPPRGSARTAPPSLRSQRPPSAHFSPPSSCSAASADGGRLVNGGVELTLRKASRAATFDPETGAHFYLNVEVSDLAATSRELAARGLALLGPPRETAIGRFARVRDPAG